MEIRALSATDWQDWKAIRLEALRLHPEAFGGSYEDELHNSDEDFQQALVRSTIFGACDGDALVGVAGFFIFSMRKMRHRGSLFSMYVRHAYRGRDVAGDLLEAVLDHARSRVQQIHCSVVTTNEAALALYKKHGFELYGTEPRALKVGDRYYDEHLMLKRFS